MIQRLQEGVLLDNEPDIKGLQIKKSDVNKITRKELTSILEDEILNPKDIKVEKVLKRLFELEDKIRTSFANKEVTFCTPGNSKTANEYKDPYSQANFRSVDLYNKLYPKNPIVLPESFNTVRLKISDINDPKIKELNKTNPEIFKILMENLFDVSTGRSKYDTNLLALPLSTKTLPDWVVPLVNIEEVLRNNLSTFLPLLYSVGGKTVQFTKDTKFVTNIIL